MFVAGCLVRMVGGQTKDVRLIEIGDEIATPNGAKLVTRTRSEQLGSHRRVIIINPGGGAPVLRMTDDTLIYTKNNRRRGWGSYNYGASLFNINSGKWDHATVRELIKGTLPLDSRRRYDHVLNNSWDAMGTRYPELQEWDYSTYDFDIENGGGAVWVNNILVATSYRAGDMNKLPPQMRPA